MVRLHSNINKNISIFKINKMAKKAINKNLDSYQSLGSLRMDFRNKILDDTGWSIGTFYLKIKNSEPLSKIEQRCFDTHLERFIKLKTQIKKHV
jgi:hypothetical protein